MTAVIWQCVIGFFAGVAVGVFVVRMALRGSR